jgi:hypothetical protein
MSDFRIKSNLGLLDGVFYAAVTYRYEKQGSTDASSPRSGHAGILQRPRQRRGLLGRLHHDVIPRTPYENVDNPIATQPRTKASTRELSAGIFDSRGIQILYDGEPTVDEAPILDEQATRFIEDRVHAKERSPALLPAGTGR